ncbi:MAG: diaminopropionate ammonia-lyase [Solirubrobacteraceae bacterium]|jgi:diaminopropionate ammonia-lyase|nr:diaminopropionate ammonia-lyase [Solirubrobacteraceae bacterium]
MRALVNLSVRSEDVAPPSAAAAPFHRALDGYAATPLRALSPTVALKDESARLGLPAFKVLGASWAVERALREASGVHTLVTASTGNHGRAVAWSAARRGLACRVFLPSRSVAARRDAIAGEGAELVVVEGVYEDAVAAARSAGEAEGVMEIADVGSSGPAGWVIDGYATLFAEVADSGREFDVVFVPVGVGALAAAAARFAATTTHPPMKVIGVEPVTAACLTASLAAGEPTVTPSAGTTMAGLDCAEVSPAAWPSLRDGVHGMVTVRDAEAHAAMRELAAAGLQIGDSGASTLAALRALASEDEGCAELRQAVGLGPESRVLLIGTEGATDPEGYRQRVPVNQP